MSESLYTCTTVTASFAALISRSSQPRLGAKARYGQLKRQHKYFVPGAYLIVSQVKSTFEEVHAVPNVS